MTGSFRAAAWPLLVGGALALSGCISLGKKLPPTLFDLTATQAVPAGAAAQGTTDQALAVLTPAAPQKLDVAQVPVQVNPSTVAYLKDAVWVEKPAQLFARLLSETIRAKGTRLVIADDDVRYKAATKLSGELVEMGYDAASGSAVVTYDAVLQQPGGQILTKRFENRVSGVSPDAAAVAPALNQAANQVAADVAAWVG